jgi:hypothetical protein
MLLAELGRTERFHRALIIVALLGGFVVLIDAVLFKTSFHPLLGAAIILAVVLLNLNSKRQ